MALSKSVLGPMMKAAVHGLSDEDARNPDKIFEALAGAWIDHFSSAAQVAGVAVGLATAPGGGVVTGTLLLPPGSIF